MEQDVEQLDDGPNTMIGPRGTKLSGGQTQRTAAARMFVREPKLLILDDLSSALDVETEQKLWERLSRWTAHLSGCFPSSSGFGNRVEMLMLKDHGGWGRIYRARADR